ELNYFRSMLVLASRLAGIASPVDGVTTALDDPAALRADALRARRFGFGGKLCIHPKQVAIVNECFTPSAEEVAGARRVLQAVRRATRAGGAGDGRLVGRGGVLAGEAGLRAAGAGVGGGRQRRAAPGICARGSERRCGRGTWCRPRE